MIRASRPNIISTNRGYILQQQETGCLREFKVRHTPEQAGQELNLIVDHGGRVKNYQHQPPRLWAHHRGNGYPLPPGCAGVPAGIGRWRFHRAFHRNGRLPTTTLWKPPPPTAGFDRPGLQDADFLAPLQPWEKEK